ncbi:MAG TPA: peptidoglycan DD-metalloendopeptidase family protein, partial [Thermoanaerobaculia bacterium]|nr:peptidoglycan DD-metalloendopeptidase family protein [Thermoanaerobaculia bacterium]
FQQWAGLEVDGAAGRATYRALAAEPPTSPLNFRRPVDGPHTDLFGPRGNRFHTGLDFPAPHGTPVHAARGGRVTVARWLEGYGYTIVVRHSFGVSTMYAHLSSFAVRDGEKVSFGERIGGVGASGSASGPHLHFEVRVRGAAVDPLTTLR